jgi:uncharacterized membrane protein YhhN
VVKILLPLAVGVGLFFSYIDHRPNFDDTGVLAFGIALLAMVFGAIEPRYPWLWALAIGGFVPLVDIFTARAWTPMIALAFAFAGAYVGGLGRTFLQREI